MVRRRQWHGLAVRVFAGWSERMGRKLPGTKARAEHEMGKATATTEALTTRTAEGLPGAQRRLLGSHGAERPTLYVSAAML